MFYHWDGFIFIIAGKRDYIKDIAGIKNETMTICHELKKQRETLEEIKKQNEEIIKLLKH